MNDNTRRRKEKKDLSVDTKIPKRQKTTITKGDVMDMSAGIIDIDDTPDVATWNKKIHIKDDAADIIVNKSDEPKTPLPRIISIGLRKNKRSKKI